MNRRHHDLHAPVREALIDIRVKLPADVSLEALQRVGAGEARYPKSARHGQVAWHLSLGTSVETSATATPLGHTFVSSDDQRSFQARLDGFAFSWRAPYESWPPFRDEARRLWDLYRALARPEVVTRIGLRYINRIDLPLPFADFDEYLRTLPEISPDMSTGVRNYFMQLQVPQEDLNAIVILNEAVMPQTNPDYVSVLLDIDVFRSAAIPSAETALWDLFAAFAERQNQVFAASITPKTQELIR